ncbi:hypothetical protein MANES_13G075604v8 [Manihot esculenta]|uniref:Uncharacterized protein n=1 Tax=Manihot esculenta TaxID=3983 RepID=A0ACB7GQN4_MANES|nr:hypothetical protein MANES_13G075604v8 [Manihot esculenta]
MTAAVTLKSLSTLKSTAALPSPIRPLRHSSGTAVRLPPIVPLLHAVNVVLRPVPASAGLLASLLFSAASSAPVLPSGAAPRRVLCHCNVIVEALKVDCLQKL